MENVLGAWGVLTGLVLPATVVVFPLLRRACVLGLPAGSWVTVAMAGCPELSGCASGAGRYSGSFACQRFEKM